MRKFLAAMLRTLKQILAPRKPTGLPYDLSLVQCSELRTLHGTKEYATFQALIDKLVTLHGEQLLLASTPEEIHRLRGTILGLRKAGTLVTEVIRQQDFEDAQRTKRTSDATDRSDERRTALYGTPFGRRPASG